MLTLRWQGNGIARLTHATDVLSSGQKYTALRRALNHTGNATFTIVKRTLAKQVGTTQAAVVKYGLVKTTRASNAALEYRITARGGPIPLKYFGANQTKKGVSARPWGNRKLYRTAFIVDSMGGHAFWRQGKERLPIERIAGPNVPKEMVKDATAMAFYRTVSTRLPTRVAHEVKLITNGVLS
ncbi:hypothetical protein ACO2I3_12295 [Leptospira interrogans]